MKKVLIFIFVSILLAQNFNIKAADEGLAPTELVKLANKEIIDMGILSDEYFRLANIDGKPLSENEHLKGNRNYIVYGQPNGDFKENRYRYLGYTRMGALFTNFLFPNDITSIKGLWDRNWIEDPKYNTLTKNRNEVKGEDTFDNNPIYEESIRLGLKLISRKNSDGSLMDFPNDKLNERQWYKYVHIYQPPTSVSWGCGIMFHNPSGNQVNYLTVPLSPDGLKGDINAQFEEIPSSAIAGDTVLIGIVVKSTINRDLSKTNGNAPLFKWEITDKTTNKPITSVTYAGYSEKDTENLDLPTNSEKVLYAAFAMPESDVNIKFEINKDGLNPAETVLDNNSLNAVITPVIPINTTGKFDLDYNVISKKVAFPLANGKDITAKLAAPKGSMTGKAWGKLIVDNETPKLFHGYAGEEIEVDEPAGTIIKHPQISSTIYRKDATYDTTTGLYDNPIEGKYLKGPDSKTISGKISFSGDAYGNYKYSCNGCQTNADGSTYCSGHTGRTSAQFNSGTDTRIITTHIYNGKPMITAKTFQNKIDYNTSNYLQKNLFWASEPYKFNVIRWMCHQNEDNSLYGWTPVPGQHQRTFTQQNSAVLNWSIGKDVSGTYKKDNSMAEEYKQAREAARAQIYEVSKYDKAVFATDIEFKKVDYPIRSGYYFNPTGTYTFTVETVTYKTTEADTKDHRDLVNAVINSFRYESDLMYINSRKEPVNLQNELLSKSGSSYNRRPAALTAQDPTGVDGLVLLNVLDRNDNEARYSKKVEELKHSQQSNGYTHEYLKAILEGYEESGTIGSKDIYKYREYLKDGQHIYRITEKTAVTIQINPENRKVYTNINMSDGKYTVMAWIDDIELSGIGNEYKKLGTLKGVYSLDKVQVTVNGSMYDDLNGTIEN
ncbi:Athe_2463 domain-containing protein [Acetivibrio cellulolyticus]|uniref:Athe_2463 domain-containing protein n=1 Tax=Acetivibrio cellulolyticus TaxID=35830 RepID=UPI0001E2EC29|nr:hypothetical protein [Acetivibrio cellulolyticus]